MHVLIKVLLLLVFIPAFPFASYSCYQETVVYVAQRYVTIQQKPHPTDQDWDSLSTLFTAAVNSYVLNEELKSISISILKTHIQQLRLNQKDQSLNKELEELKEQLQLLLNQAEDLKDDLMFLSSLPIIGQVIAQPHPKKPQPSNTKSD